MRSKAGRRAPGWSPSKMSVNRSAALPGWWAGLLTLTVLFIYLPALKYGLIWDDPRFYEGVRLQTSLTQMFTSPQPPTFQFYRPLATLYNNLLMSPEGVVNAPLAHAVQITAHLITVLALGPVLAGFQIPALQARLAALLFAIYPLSYFGVAWQQNQQPLMVMCLMVSLLVAQRYAARRKPSWLIGSVLLYVAALLFQEGALPFVAAFLALGWLDRQTSSTHRWPRWPLAFIGATAVYLVVWISLPLVRGVTGPGFQLDVMAYFLQGVVFPVAQWLTPWISAWPSAALLALFGAVWLGLLLGEWKRNSLFSAAFSVGWILIGILPLWAGLSWDYARLGPRLIYPAAIGIATLWAGWGIWTFTARGWWRWVGALTLTLVIGTSAWQLWQFQRMFQAGTQHLAQAVRVLSASPGKRLLFVNFPDQYEVRPALYPLGFWGPILAPVVQDLSDYARVLKGPSAEDRSLASFLTGDRSAFPYRMFMRGVDSSPDQLVEAARWAEAVYLTDYLPEGAFRLVEAGAVREASSDAPPLARIGETAELVSATSDPDLGTLRLVWRCQQPLQPDDTIFVHLWRAGEFVGGTDGDSLGGLIPPAAWPVGAEIVDVRPVSAANLPVGEYEIRVGLYNRTSGERYLTTLPDGSVSDTGLPVGEWHAP